jgi:hypothetical protein
MLKSLGTLPNSDVKWASDMENPLDRAHKEEGRDW